jgi:outer membrane protein OmpA-like peptidoglycan-associated protein
MKTLLVMIGLAAGFAAAQTPQSAPPENPPNKPVKAISYRARSGVSKVALIGTGIAPNASGEARVDAPRTGATTIEISVQGLEEPTRFGAEFLTYVLWAVSPEGSTYNLGEVRTDANGGLLSRALSSRWQLKTTTQLQVFSLFVTAEPYFAVHQPSEVMILENEIRDDTKGDVVLVHEYKLMARAQYQRLGNPLALSVDLKRVPLEMYEARNAVDIARSRGADRYAPDIFAKVLDSLKKAEDAFQQKAHSPETISAARQTVQFAEDARVLAVQRQDEEKVTQERTAAAAQAKAQAEAKAAAEAAEAKRLADAEAQRQAEIADAREAKLKAEAELAAMKAKMDADAQAAKAQAEAAKAQAEAATLAEAKAEAEARAVQIKADADAQAAKAQAAALAMKAQEQAAVAEAEKAKAAAEALRAQLLEQFNRILDTRDTDRGLVVNLSDVLFDTGKFDLRSLAREKLARFSGIVLGHPGLRLDIEGYTDSVGSDELNMKLSEQRADAVRQYLIAQGLADTALTAKGFGKSLPVADNATAAGRQQNRRVEIVVSGEVIGTKIGK